MTDKDVAKMLECLHGIHQGVLASSKSLECIHEIHKCLCRIADALEDYEPVGADKKS